MVAHRMRRSAKTAVIGHPSATSPAAVRETRLRAGPAPIACFAELNGSHVHQIRKMIPPFEALSLLLNEFEINIGADQERSKSKEIVI